MIEREYYIIAVYDDPGKCTVTFAAYELETDKTFTLPYTYSELDELFRFNSELMNPKNTDERYHWVIERLDFMLEDAFHKKLCLAPEPTPDEEPSAPKTNVSKPFHTGKIDAATRAKLLNELDTMDDSQLQLNLVRSENARMAFLQDLHSRRRLEQLKALQRICMLDEDRAERLKELSDAEKYKKDKAQKYTKEAQATVQTMAHLEVLMKQKEADTIRKLLNEKEKQEYEREQRFELSLQNKKQRERSWKEQRAFEGERTQNMNKRREEVSIRRDDILAAKSKEILRKRQRDIDMKMRLRQQRTESQKQGMAADAVEKVGKNAEEEKKKQMNEMLNRSRAQKDMEKYMQRSAGERERIVEIKFAVEEDTKLARKRKEEYTALQLSEAKVSAKKRALVKIQCSSMDERRDENIELLMVKREKRRKEEQWLEERQKSANVETIVEDEETLRLKFEAEAREQRRQKRESMKEEVEKKTAAVFESTARLRDLQEAQRMKKCKADEYARRAMVEQTRLEKERREREEKENQMRKVAKRESTFNDGEVLRDQKEHVKQDNRQNQVVERVKAVPIGYCISKSCLAI